MRYHLTLRYAAFALILTLVGIGAFAQSTLIKSKGKGIVTINTSQLKVGEDAEPFLVKDRSIQYRDNSPFSLKKALVLPFSSHSTAHKIVGAPELCGSILYDDNWESAQYGIYAISTVGPWSPDPLVLNEEYYFNMGGVRVGDVYYGNFYRNMFNVWIRNITYAIDLKSMTTLWSHENTSWSALCWSMAYDETTGNIYACSYTNDGTGYQFGIWNPDGESATETICSLAQPWPGLGVDAEGQVFAIDESGTVYKVDKNTGAQTKLIETGYATEYTCGAVLDSRANIFYWYPVKDDGCSMCAIDLSTCQVAHVYTSSRRIQATALYVPTDNTPAQAPDRAVINNIDFADGQLTGSITFTSPGTLFDGSEPASSAKLSCEILVNDEVIDKEEDLSYGQIYTFPLEIEKDGYYKFTVALTNENATSVSGAYYGYVGLDRPVAPSSPTLAYKNQKLTLSWNASTTSENGGYIGKITYNVYDVEHNLVAQNIEQCSWEEDITEPDDFTTLRYYVRAVSEGIESEEAVSNSLYFGAYNPPMSESFEDEEIINAWTIIDDNNDGYTWYFNHTEMGIPGSSIGMHDWLISPAVRLKGGYHYEVTVEACGAHLEIKPERFSLWVGTANTSAAMTTNLIPTTEVDHMAFLPYSGSFIPQEDGIYYFGVLGESEADKYYLFIDSFSISAGEPCLAPAQVENLEFLPNRNGALNATISFNLPTTTIDGHDLGEYPISKYEIRVNDQLVCVKENPQMGEYVCYTYQAQEDGEYLVEVLPYNENGQGIAAEAKTYIGINIPAAPTEVKIQETENGIVDITWTPPTTDADGYDFNSSLCTYTIIGPQGVVAENLTEPHFTHQALKDADDQEFVYYAVYAVSKKGASGAAYSDMLPIGAPYSTPFQENFSNQEVHYIWGVDASSEDVMCTIGSDDMYADIQSHTGDNGYFLSLANAQYDWCSLTTGKITLPNDNPILRYYYYTITADDANTIDITITCAGEEHGLHSHDCAGAIGWNRMEVDLKEFAGETVYITFKFTTINYVITLIDDVRIGELQKYDLEAANLQCESIVRAGEETPILYTVTNYGLMPLSDYQIEMYCDGELLTTISDVPTIEAGESVTGATTHTFKVTQRGDHSLHFAIICDLDEYVDNNISPITSIYVTYTDYPTVALDGELDEAGAAVLSWTSPNLEVEDFDVVEDFEDPTYEPFSTSDFGPWTLLNFNTSDTWMIDNITFPEILMPFGFILFVPEEADGNATSKGMCGYPDGGNFLAAYAHQDGKNNDAWLISPKLTGEAQKVTFMARSYDTRYGCETMMAYYSVSGNGVDDFIEVSIEGYPQKGLTTEWTQCSIDLPEGALYFALQSTGKDLAVLMIDDIAYKYANPIKELELQGYNVYRNDELIASLDAQATSYVDKDAPEGTNSYQVTAVYQKGESGPSNKVRLSVGGLSDTESRDASVWVEDCILRVEGAKSTIVTVPNGMTIFHSAEPSVSLSVSPGIYLVKVNNTIYKLRVK